MFRLTIFVVSVLFIFCGGAFDLSGQTVNANSNLKDLPITLSFDREGIRITTNTNASRNLLDMVPYKYLDQIGNDLIKISLDTKNTPVVIDLSDYYQNKFAHNKHRSDQLASNSKIKVYMPKLTLRSNDASKNFILELRNYARGKNNLQQTFIIKGIDVFYVGVDKSAIISAKQNHIILDIEKSRVDHLQLKGGILNLFNIEDKLPGLCRKYNERYFGNGRDNAFICLKDCKPTDPNTPKHQRHGRKLITKYNITDFEDAAVSFLSEIIITKKGLGINLKTETPAKGILGKKKKKATLDPNDAYYFFPWYEFVNLHFEKHVDEHQLLIKDPFNHTYVYDSKVHFSNVELIQFFNELKKLITTKHHDVMP